MYVYQLTHVRGVDIKVIGYFGSWKKARQVMKKYRSQVQGFKDYPRCFKIKKLRVNQDDFYMDKKNYVQMKNDGRKNFIQNDIRFKLDC